MNNTLEDKIEWLPNWRNKEEYPNDKTTTRQEWGWEFLRRNPQYWSDYNELIQLRDVKNNEFDNLAYNVFLSFYGPMSFEKTVTTPFQSLCNNLLPSLWLEKESYPWVPDVCWKMIEVYNLKSPVDPSRLFNPGIFMPADDVPMIEHNNCIINQHVIPEHRKLICTFDMEKSLNVQIDYLKGVVTQLCMLQNKPFKDGFYYRDALRILDGTYAHALSNVIMKVLKITAQSTYYQRRTEAQHLRDVNFFQLSATRRKKGLSGSSFDQGKSDGEKLKNFVRTDRSSLKDGTCISEGNFEIFLK